MPPSPDDPVDKTTSFLKRWSDRKARATHPDADQQGEPLVQSPLTAEDRTAESAETAPPVTEADLENLSYDSDYTKFMGTDVPEALRRQALRQLWRSDPILANVDGLCDYAEDYTDAALVVKTLQTAHRVGQGYLTDEEVAANRARGEPRALEADAMAKVDDNSSEDEVTVAATQDETVPANGGEIVTASAPVEPATDDATPQNDHAADTTDQGAVPHKPEPA